MCINKYHMRYFMYQYVVLNVSPNVYVTTHLPNCPFREMNNFMKLCYKYTTIYGNVTAFMYKLCYY